MNRRGFLGWLSGLVASLPFAGLAVARARDDQAVEVGHLTVKELVERRLGSFSDKVVATRGCMEFRVTEVGVSEDGSEVIYHHRGRAWQEGKLVAEMTRAEAEALQRALLRPGTVYGNYRLLPTSFHLDVYTRCWRWGAELKGLDRDG